MTSLLTSPYARAAGAIIMTAGFLAVLALGLRAA